MDDLQGENLGKGGVDLTPSEERAAPQAPAQFQFDASTNPESITRPSEGNSPAPDTVEGQVDGAEAPRPKLLPRETGHDIGMGSPVPLSAEAVGIITRLRNMKVSTMGPLRKYLYADLLCSGRSGRLGPLARRRLPCQGRLIALRCQCASASAEQAEERRAGADACLSGRQRSGCGSQG